MGVVICLSRRVLVGVPGQRQCAVAEGGRGKQGDQLGHQIGAQEGWRDAQVARRGVWSGCSGECGFYGVQQAGFGVSGRGQRGFVRSSFSSAGAVCFFVCV